MLNYNNIRIYADIKNAINYIFLTAEKWNRQFVAEEYMDKVLFHTFTTEGYAHWSELYLESLRYIYGDSVNVRMDALNLKDSQANILKKIHSGLDLRNHQKDYRQAAREEGIDPEKFELWKDEVTAGKATEESYLFKVYISVNQRYRNMQSVIQEAKKDGYKYLIHSDVDIYFRKSLDGLLQILNENDFAAYFRNREKCSQKILGAFLAFNLQKNADVFVKEWMKQIDAVPYRQRWRGFGQSVLWYASENTKNMTSIADLSNYNQAPVYSQMYDGFADFWLGSNSISSRKHIPLKKAWKDFKKGFPRISAKEPHQNLKSIMLEPFHMFYDLCFTLARRINRKIHNKW